MHTTGSSQEVNVKDASERWLLRPWGYKSKDKGHKLEGSWQYLVWRFLVELQSSLWRFQLSSTCNLILVHSLHAVPDPNSSIADRFQYLVQGRRVWGLLNRCEQSDNLSSRGSLLQIKQGCSAIDRSTHATTNAHKQMNSTWWRWGFFFLIKLNRNDVTSKWIVDIPKICSQIPRPSFPARVTGSDPHFRDLDWV